MALSGTGTISAGETSVTITHTYGAVPPAVAIEPQVFLGANSYRVTNKTTTQFTVELYSPMMEDFTFAWAITTAVTEAAATGDQYCTVAKAKEAAAYLYTELNFDSDSDYETYVSNVIDRASRSIDRYCQRPTNFFNGGATVTEYQDGRSTSSAVYAGTDRAMSQELSNRTYQLRQTPVLSVTSISVNSADIGSSDSWTSTSMYRLDSESGRIIFASTSQPEGGQNNVRFIYVAGYATLPDEIKWACEELVANVIKKGYADMVNSRIRFSRPMAVSLANDSVFTQDIKDLLQPYRKVNL